LSLFFSFSLWNEFPVMEHKLICLIREAEDEDDADDDEDEEEDEDEKGGKGRLSAKSPPHR